MTPAQILQLAAGVVGTWAGAELLVRGSVRLAIAVGLRPMLVGLTVVAFGTSSPEAVVSFVAAARGSGGIAVGNVLGSNIANIGLILGLVSLIHPMSVGWIELRRDLWLMGLATVLAAAAIWTGFTGRLTGVVLLLLLFTSLVLSIRHAGKARDGSTTEEGAEGGARARAIAQSVVGLVLLVLAARLLVGSAEQIARQMGINEAIIGATMVAVGTSLPELAASIVAVMRGHYDIGIGNIVGSNLMNLTFVFGTVCLIEPITVPAEARGLLLLAMLVFSAALVPILATGGRVGRLEGGFLLVAYFAFAWFAYF